MFEIDLDIQTGTFCEYCICGVIFRKVICLLYSIVLSLEMQSFMLMLIKKNENVKKK